MNVDRIKRLSAYVLPFIVIISQFIEIGPLKFSWLLSIILGLYVASKLGRVLNNFLILIFIALICVVPLLTFFWNITGRFNTLLYFSLFTGLLIFLYINEMEQKELLCFLRGCFAACLIFSIWGTFEILSGKYFLFENEEFIFRLNAYGRHYPGVAFTNTNDLTQYLAILLPLTSIIFWKKNFFTINNILIVIANVLTVFDILNSHSKLGMFSFLATWFLFIITYCLVKKSYLILLSVFSGIATYGIICMKYNVDIIKEIVKRIFSIDMSAGYFTGRADIYITLAKTSFCHPFGGFGNAYEVTGIQGGPHNFFLFIMCDLGMIGALLFVCILAFLAIRLLKKAKQEYNVIIYLAVLSTLFLFPITSCISSGNEQRKIIWIFLGICVRIAHFNINDLRKALKKYD